MGIYKEIEIPDVLMGVIEHMRALERDREELNALTQQWDLLTILGQMNDSGTDMTKTRQDFKVLTSKLLSALGSETLNKMVQSITAKSQVAVDIVIRNLFERTADIGFLATDDDIRSFVRIVADQATDPAVLEAQSDKLKSRFYEYVKKYSVYENIILLDTEGKLLCQYDNKNKIEKTDPDLLMAALKTENEYVESFVKSNLCPGREKSLLYSFRVRETNDRDSKAIGVLFLVFRFEDELASVFKNLLPEDDWTVLTLLDSNGRVIASSDSGQVAIDSQQILSVNDEFKITKYAGRLFLSKTSATKGYQGFRGLGWYGHAMVPLEYAFNDTANGSSSKIPQIVLESVMDDPRLFSEQLRAIPEDAENIQSELDRTVWNGNLATHDSSNQKTASANKVLLWEISVTGNKTKKVFERSINQLHQSVVNSILNDISSVSSLAIDIMDRNLYERANDCRWWALTTSFKEILSDENRTPEDLQKMKKVLAYINGLYTVYSNLFVFDNSGKVLAVSKSSEEILVGKVLSNEFIHSVLSLSSSQQYRVSKFQNTDLYQQRPTYIYGAAIFDSKGSSKNVGGIGIVFDSEPQFKQILEDSLPRNKAGAIPEGSFSTFTTRSGEIISTTSNQHKIGGKIELPEQFYSIKNGEKYSAVVEVQDHYYAVGGCCSKGYREFKDSGDEYKNDVIALTFMRLGKMKSVGRTQHQMRQHNFKIKNGSRALGTKYIDVATFHIGSLWVGIRTDQVQGSIVVENVTPIPATNKSLKGVAMYDDKPIYLIQAYESFGIQKPESSNKLSQVVVIKTDFGPVGVIVDRLGEIPSVPEDQIVVDQLLVGDGISYVEGIVRLEDDQKNGPILVIMNPSQFVRAMMGNGGSDVLKALTGIDGKQEDGQPVAPKMTKVS